MIDQQQQVNVTELQRLNEAILLTMDAIRRVAPHLAQIQLPFVGGQTIDPLTAAWVQAQTMRSIYPQQQLWGQSPWGQPIWQQYAQHPMLHHLMQQQLLGQHLYGQLGIGGQFPVGQQFGQPFAQQFGQGIGQQPYAQFGGQVPWQSPFGIGFGGQFPVGQQYGSPVTYAQRPF
jgi:hypothetical protein